MTTLIRMTLIGDYILGIRDYSNYETARAQLASLAVEAGCELRPSVRGNDYWEMVKPKTRAIESLWQIV